MQAGSAEPEPGTTNIEAAAGTAGGER